MFVLHGTKEGKESSPDGVHLAGDTRRESSIYLAARKQTDCVGASK